MASSPADAPPSPHEPGARVLIPGVVSLLDAQRRTLKHGDTYALFDDYGDILDHDGSPAGLFHQDMRHLAGLRFRIEDRAPLLLSSTVQRNNFLLNVDLTNPDVYDGKRLVLEKDSFHVARTKFLWQAGCYELFRISSYLARAYSLRVSLTFGTDFADMFEVRGHRRSQCGLREVAVEGRDAVVYSYHGLDGRLRRTRLVFHPAPTRLDISRAEWTLDFGPRERKMLSVTVQCLVGEGEEGKARETGFFTAIRHARRAYVHAGRRGAAIKTSNELINEVLARSSADLTMLVTDTAEGPYPYAGVPWFCTAFGRDGLITAIETLWADPSIARGVLRFLAATQADRVDPDRDAEPGKILHETRQGELAQIGEVPFGRYYGSVDATPLFVVLGALYWERTRDEATLRAIWPNIKAALHWIDRYGDVDGDGFVEYGRRSEGGLRNQGWKDSGDSIFHADGALAEGPIALCEVQGYVYQAKIGAARIARDLGEPVLAGQLETEARRLRERFEDVFWCEPLGTYALALDGRKRPCAVRTSNAGHALYSGIASPERARRVARGLFDSSFFTGWGIRTVSDKERRFNPASYHNGSIWPHDNAIIALGLARYGFKDEVLRLTQALFEAAEHMELRRLPELYCGFKRKPDKSPVLYPVACSPQAWAACAPFALLQACLGLELDAASGTVRLLRPYLPVSLEWLQIRDLQVGQARVDLLVRGQREDVAVSLLRREGGGQVEILL